MKKQPLNLVEVAYLRMLRKLGKLPLPDATRLAIQIRQERTRIADHVSAEEKGRYMWTRHSPSPLCRCHQCMQEKGYVQKP